MENIRQPGLYLFGRCTLLLLPFFSFVHVPTLANDMATDVQAKLTYLQWQPSYAHTRPYRIGQFVGRRNPRKEKQREKTTNLVFCAAEHAETIRDIRGLTDGPAFTLDCNGFVYIKCSPPALAKAYDYSDREKIENIFLPECEDILRRHVDGADEVIIFDWKVGQQYRRQLTVSMLNFHCQIRKRKSAKERRRRNPNLQGFARQVHIGTKIYKHIMTRQKRILTISRYSPHPRPHRNPNAGAYSESSPCRVPPPSLRASPTNQVSYTIYEVDGVSGLTGTVSGDQ